MTLVIIFPLLTLLTSLLRLLLVYFSTRSWIIGLKRLKYIIITSTGKKNRVTAVKSIYPKTSHNYPWGINTLPGGGREGKEKITPHNLDVTQLPSGIIFFLIKVTFLMIFIEICYYIDK